MKVLLLEDEPTHDSHFEKVFGVNDVDCCRSIADVTDALKSATSWHYAFLDFDLGRKSTQTGLSAFALLKAQSPRTKLVGFTNVGENSRTLFAVAAYRWFGMWGLLNKPEATTERLNAIANGSARMPNAKWQDALRDQAWLVDQLFANPRWAPLWQAVLRGQARSNSLANLVPGESEGYVRKTFLPAASDAAVNFSTAFLEDVELNHAKPQLTLMEFVRQNRTFFMAPDLLDILHEAEPWAKQRPTRSR